MAKTTFDIKSEATRYLYAGAGVADLAAEVVRDYVADVQAKFNDLQQDVQKTVKDIDFEPKALRDQAVTKVNARVNELSDEVNGTYVGLAKRGEALVVRIRNQESTQETAASMEQMTSSMEDVASSAQKLSDMAIQLREHVGRFKISVIDQVDEVVNAN